MSWEASLYKTPQVGWVDSSAGWDEFNIYCCGLDANMTLYLPWYLLTTSFPVSDYLMYNSPGLSVYSGNLDKGLSPLQVYLVSNLYSTFVEIILFRSLKISAQPIQELDKACRIM